MDQPEKEMLSDILERLKRMERRLATLEREAVKPGLTPASLNQYNRDIDR